MVMVCTVFTANCVDKDSERGFVQVLESYGNEKKFPRPGKVFFFLFFKWAMEKF